MEYTERLIFREEVLRRANGLLPSDCASFETDDNQFVLQYLPKKRGTGRRFTRSE